MSIEQKSTSNQPEKQSKKSFRLNVTTRIGLFLLVLSPMLTSCSGSKPPLTEPIPISTPTLTPELIHTLPPSFSKIDFGSFGIRRIIALNEEGLPIYFIGQDDRPILFDRKHMQELKEKAIALQETQIFFEETSSGVGKRMTPIEQRPETPELPDDVLSDEELRTRGIEIIQGDNTHLYIRKDAFSAGDPLEDFARGERELIIVLIESDYRINKDLQAKLEKFLGRDNVVGPIVGSSYHSSKDGRNAVIFTNVDGMNSYEPGHVKRMGMAYAFTINGRVTSHQMNRYLEVEKGEDNYTYPDPDNFLMDPMEKSYPYTPRTPGSTLRHEVEHDVMIGQAINKALKPNHSEYDTEIESMRGIRSAWEKWQKSGYTDNSGYYFVFSLPNGGYILTRRKKSGKSLRREHLRERRLSRLEKEDASSA